MSKKKHPPKEKHYADLKQRAKALSTNLMYAIYKDQMKEGFSDEEAHRRVTEVLNSRNILLFPEDAAQRYEYKKNHFAKRLKRDNVPANLNKMEAIYQKANATLKALEANIFDLQHMQDDLQKLSPSHVKSDNTGMAVKESYPSYSCVFAMNAAYTSSFSSILYVLYSMLF